MSDLKAAVCRGCGKILKGGPYHKGGHAYHPITGERARVNFYGGFVCSFNCDRKSSLEMESSFPGAGRATTLSTFARQSLKSNWGES